MLTGNLTVQDARLVQQSAIVIHVETLAVFLVIWVGMGTIACASSRAHSPQGVTVLEGSKDPGYNMA